MITPHTEEADLDTPNPKGRVWVASGDGDQARQFDLTPEVSIRTLSCDPCNQSTFPGLVSAYQE